MLLLVEIALTVWVFQRGWRGYALIPMSAGVVTGFAIGLFGVRSGLDMDLIFGLALALDALMVGSLVAMGAIGRNTAEQRQTIETTPQELEIASGSFRTT